MVPESKRKASSSRPLFWVLGVIVTVVIVAGVVYVWASSFTCLCKSSPSLDATLERRPDGYILTITKAEPAVITQSFVWRIIDNNESELVSGRLVDSHGLNFAYRNLTGQPTGFISVQGNHSTLAYARLHSGSKIIFKTDFINFSFLDMRLDLIFAPTKENVMSFYFNEAIWNPNPLPEQTLNSISKIGTFDSNLSFGAQEPLSHTPIYSRQEWELSVNIINKGNHTYKSAYLEVFSNITDQQFISSDDIDIFPNSSTKYTFFSEFPFDLDSNNRSNYGYYPFNLTIKLFDNKSNILLEGYLHVDTVRASAQAPSFQLSFTMLALSVLIVGLAKAIFRARTIAEEKNRN